MLRQTCLRGDCLHFLTSTLPHLVPKGTHSCFRSCCCSRWKISCVLQVCHSPLPQPRCVPVNSLRRRRWNWKARPLQKTGGLAVDEGLGFWQVLACAGDGYVTQQDLPDLQVSLHGGSVGTLEPAAKMWSMQHALATTRPWKCGESCWSWIDGPHLRRSRCC
jgi:hypothetical protein